MINWKEIDSKVSIKIPTLYSSELRYFANLAKSNREFSDASLLELVADVASYNLDVNRSNDLFGPMWQGRNERSTIPDDLSKEQLELLGSMVKDIDITALRARIRDVLWTHTRNHEEGRLAITDYIEHAKLLEKSDSVNSYYALERSLQLKRKLGAKEINELVIIVDEAVDRAILREDNFLVSKLIESLLSRKLGDSKKYSLALGNFAQKNINVSNFHYARVFFELQAEAFRISGEEENAKNALIAAANTFVNEAEAASNAGTNSLSAHHYMQAIAALRKIGGQQQYTEKLHHRLLEVEGKSASEFSTVSHELNIDPKHFEDARAFVTGKSNWQEALVSLAISIRISQWQKLKENYEKNSEGLVMQKIMPTQIKDKHGLSLGILPPLVGPSGENDEKVYNYHVFQEASLSRQIDTLLFDEMRDQINKEFRIPEREMCAFLSYSPFVPPGREVLFAKGILAGLEGDWIIALHLLVPQLENALRYHLRQHGCRISYLNSEFVQHSAPLSAFIFDFKNELIEIFSEDIYFVFRGLIGDSLSSNLRNRPMHGLMDVEDFNNREIQYLWWVIVRLCFSHSISLIQDKTEINDNDQVSSNPSIT